MRPNHQLTILRANLKAAHSTSIPNIVASIITMILNKLSCMITHIHLKMKIYLSVVKHNIIMFTTK